MKKVDLQIENIKLLKQISLAEGVLTNIRQVARDVIPKGTNINPVWVIEKVTEILTKIEK